MDVSDLIVADYAAANPGGKFTLVGDKGIIFKADADMQVKPEHNEEQHLPAVIQMVNTKFDEFGNYEFQVSINGESKASQILTIRQEPQPAQASPQ